MKVKIPPYIPLKLYEEKMDSIQYTVIGKFKRREITRNIEGENLTYHYNCGELNYVKSTYEKNGVIISRSFRYYSWVDSEGPHSYSEYEKNNIINEDEYDFVWKSYFITMDGEISIEIIEEGIVRKGVTDNHGRLKKWDINGKILKDLTYDYGEPIGTHRTYHKNGQLKFEGSYSNNHEPLGEHVEFDFDGFINKKYIYKDGWKKFEEINYYYESNSIRSVKNIKDGLNHGQYRHFTKDGRIIEEGEYERGNKVGSWIVNEDLINNEDDDD